MKAFVHWLCMVQTSYNLNGTPVCSRVNAYILCPTHSYMCLQYYYYKLNSHYPSILRFHTLSGSHLCMLNDAETHGEYSNNNLSHASRIKMLKNMGLKERNGFIVRQGTPRAFLNAKQCK